MQWLFSLHKINCSRREWNKRRALFASWQINSKRVNISAQGVFRKEPPRQVYCWRPEEILTEEKDRQMGAWRLDIFTNPLCSLRLVSILQFFLQQHCSRLTVASLLFHEGSVELHKSCKIDSLVDLLLAIKHKRGWLKGSCRFACWLPQGNDVFLGCHHMLHLVG